MSTIKYFAGERELTRVYHVGPYANAASFRGYPEGVEPVFVPGLGWTGSVAADRMVTYKSNPSRHACDARCMNATGRMMKCECSCGGKNHGRGCM